MKDIQQLIKKDSQQGRYESIFPKTFIDAITDKTTGTALQEILAGFNMLFLPYNSNKGQTRLQVPASFRREGLWITYVMFDKTVVTEWYAAEAIDDVSWAKDSNWREGLTSSIWKNYRGYTNERPVLKVADDGYPFYDRNLSKYIVWNGVDWVNIDGSTLN